ncbi:GntR family transcriptional regulator [Glycomyces harbinensis]|uniref:DNA-binding transcriptional regulator YhcF, GntR family n=1 Tax=Glycomyces harbinensis TaxID=58114 RepID=A0A1G6WRK2_9ACTN|nr:GntR family transcriptional regulator [Glycomyces harbinensis]SDD67827.1 DNA-binding transcriptional regulator YhcF, GntR family [Glycomyces harbinensis]
MFDDGAPIYRQIADQIKAEIMNGSLQPGGKVMSTNQYAAFYQINPATAQKAFRELVDEGVLYKQRGVGMFVADDARDKLAADFRDRFFERVLAPLVREARQAGIPLTDIIDYLRASDGNAGGAVNQTEKGALQ